MDALATGSRREAMEVVGAKLGCKVDLSEVFSPLRIATMASEVGLRRGFSLDFTCKRVDGEYWNLSNRK